jgi:hypothetical protein
MTEVEHPRLESRVDRCDRTSDVAAREHLREGPGQRVRCAIERTGSTVVNADSVTSSVERLSTIVRSRQPARRVADAHVQLRVIGHPKPSHLRHCRRCRGPTHSDGSDDLSMRIGKSEPPASHADDFPGAERPIDVASLATRRIEGRIWQHPLVPLQLPDHRFHVSSVAIRRVGIRASGAPVESQGLKCMRIPAMSR